jgi:hypothetical protein
MMDFSELANNPEHRRGLERLLFQAAKRGDAELVAERLGWGVDPNCTFGPGLTPLLVNVRGVCPNVAVVRVLLEFGADPQSSDKGGLNVLDYARRKLMRLASRNQPAVPPLASPCEGGGSESLDENLQLVLGAEEQAELDRMRAELGADGAEFARLYWRERLRAARRVFNDPREVEAIVDLLEAVNG